MKTKTNQLVSHIVTNECINIETIEDITVFCWNYTLGGGSQKQEADISNT